MKPAKKLMLNVMDEVRICDEQNIMGHALVNIYGPCRDIASNGMCEANNIDQDPSDIRDISPEVDSVPEEIRA